MVSISKLTKKRLGELLISEGLVNEEQINEALKRQQETGGLLGEVLIALGYVTEIDIARTITTQFGLPYIDASRYFVAKEVAALLPEDEMRRNQYVPLDKIGNILTLAVCGLLNEKTFEDIEKRTGCVIQLYVSTVSQVARAMDKVQAMLQSKK
jgi:type IV pilus assembly protein PilB